MLTMESSARKARLGLIALLTFVKILVKYIQLIKPVNCSSMSNGGRRWDVMEK